MIHFYKKGYLKEKSLFVVSDSLYSEIENVLTLFEEKTGIFLDPYGKTLLIPQNLTLLFKLIEQANSKSQIEKNNDLNNFLSFLNNSSEANLTIEAIGD